MPSMWYFGYLYTLPYWCWCLEFVLVFYTIVWAIPAYNTLNTLIWYSTISSSLVAKVFVLLVLDQSDMLNPRCPRYHALPWVVWIDTLANVHYAPCYKWIGTLANVHLATHSPDLRCPWWSIQMNRVLYHDTLAHLKHIGICKLDFVKLTSSIF